MSAEKCLPTAAAGGDRATRIGIACIAVLTAFGVIAYAPHLELFVLGMRHERLFPLIADRDFANYWVAARMTLEGMHHELFDQEAYFARLQALFGENYSPHNWGYPPHFLLFTWPLGLLGYRAALLSFLVATFLVYLCGVLVFHRTYAPRSSWIVLAAAILGYALVVIDATQNGFLLAGLLLLGLACMKQRPALAGLCFAALTIKPQLGLLIPFLLLSDRNWRALAWSAGSTVLLFGISAIAFGIESWTLYLDRGVGYQTGSVMAQWGGIFLRMMPTAFAGVRTLGFTVEIAYIVQAVVSCIGATMVAWLLWRERDALRRIFAIVCGTFIISPYAFNYDMGALTAIAAMLVGARTLTTHASVIVVSIIAALPVAVMNLGRADVPIASIVLMASLAALIAELPTTRGASSMPAAA